jgi:glycosyltransferase involved in cell wall biosynthesis
MSSSSPRTMYVTHSLDGGGAERLLTNVILQQERPECAEVVSLRSGGVFRPALEAAGVEVTDLGMTGYRHGPLGLIRLARLIRAHRPDVVHSWDYFTNLMVVPACRLARSHARLFWSAFGTACTQQKGKYRYLAVVHCNALLSRFVDGVVYNGAEVRDYHRAVGFREPRSVVISNSIDADVFRRDAGQRDAVREELGLKPDDVVVAVVARVHAQKDWPTVCEAVRDLPGVKTMAVGSGTAALPPQPGLLRLGWRDDVASILSAADIFLLASAFGEGFSLSLGEAMLCGLPCIVTDVGGNGRLAGDAGVVVQPRNIAAIRGAIASLAADPARRRELGRRARARAAAATSLDGSLQRLHALELAAERR